MIKFTNKFGAILKENTELVSVMDEDKELFTLSKANVESILDLFGQSTKPEQFDPITKWEKENPESYAAAKDKFCCLHVEKQEILMADEYDDVKSEALKKFGKDEVDRSCCFFQGPKSQYQIHSIAEPDEPR